MTKEFGVAIIGGSGYGAGELLRLLCAHPLIEVAAVTSRTHAGKSVASVHTNLERISPLSFSERLSNDWIKPYNRSVIICSVPTGNAIPTINEILDNNPESLTPIIDLSGDLRLTDPTIHSKHYPEVPFSPELRSQAIYGLPETTTDQRVAKARIITNPGCLATAAILALAPLRDTNAAIHVAVDGKTGTSGAGREPQPAMHHPSRAHDCTAYKVLEHRHEPEILQALGATFSARDSFMFVPHLLPVSRGCLVSCYIACRDADSAASLPELYHAFYAGARFVRLRERPSRLVDVVGTNFCDLHVVVRGKHVTISSALDNLGKGMAGQCIQNLNLLLGLPEETGLMASALGPV
jgi:N-acetyl-gamma-glutamyl-phosphate reductase